MLTLDWSVLWDNSKSTSFRSRFSGNSPDSLTLPQLIIHSGSVDTTCLICPNTHNSPLDRIMYSFPNNRALLKLHARVSRSRWHMHGLTQASGCLFRFMVGFRGRCDSMTSAPDPMSLYSNRPARNNQSLIMTQGLLLERTYALFMWGKGQAIEVAPSRKSWIFNTDLHFYPRPCFFCNRCD